MMARSLFALLLLMPFTLAAAQVGRVYVYASAETAVKSWTPVLCDGAPVAKIQRGTYFAIDLAPGFHLFEMQRGIPLSVEAVAGKQVFVRLDWYKATGEKTFPRFEIDEADFAKQAMKELRYIEGGKVMSDRVPRTVSPPKPAAP